MSRQSFVAREIDHSLIYGILCYCTLVNIIYLREKLIFSVPILPYHLDLQYKYDKLS